MGGNAHWGVQAMRRFFAIFKDEQGATAVEYGLILALIFLAMIGGVTQFSSTTIEMWNYVANSVSGA
jgi:pilus assembly protein Flp/PilA